MSRKRREAIAVKRAGCFGGLGDAPTDEFCWCGEERGGCLECRMAHRKRTKTAKAKRKPNLPDWDERTDHGQE
jgi:hypothetical protein